MGIVCTNTWPGAGSAWTAAANNSSDGSAWTQTTSLINAWVTLTTSASSNVGTFTASCNSSGSGAVWRTGASSPNDAHAHAVLSLSRGQATGTVQGIILNKTATTANTFYLATFNVSTKGGTTYYGIELRKYVSGAGYTTLVSVLNTLPGLFQSTAKWVLQFRTSRLNNGTSLLLQARGWQGTDPSSPPAGADWVGPGVINTGSNYQSIGTEDTSPLAAGRGGLALVALQTNSFTGTFEQFEFRQMSATTLSITKAQAVTDTATVGKRLTSTALASTLSTKRTALLTRLASTASTVTGIRTISALRDTTTSLTATATRATTTTVNTVATLNATTIRTVAAIITTTATTTTSTTRSIALTIANAIATTATAAKARAVAIAVTVGTSVIALARRLVPEPPRIVQLTQRSTTRLAQTVTTRIPGRSIVSWAQSTVARITGRSTLRLPKE
jgi:hypothetical protein